MTTTTDIGWRRGDELREFVAVHGGLKRVVASFAGLTDLLYMTGVHPKDLEAGIAVHGDARMLVQAIDGAWSAVDYVNVGYGGTGPRLGADQLRRLGLDEDLADVLTSFRVVDADLTADGTASRLAGTHTWPLIG